MRQNIYDDSEFFANYSRMPRSVGGLESAEEWPAFRALLPDLAGKRVLDLGCGFGWHCRYAREQQAAYVLGVDLSEKMLARARDANRDLAIDYRCCAIEDFHCEPDAFDVVISSAAFHYVERFDLVCETVFMALVRGGCFVFSAEHPIFTSRSQQEWHAGPDGRPLHWPVDRYHDEGIRHTRWMGDDVAKYHRTMATYVNTLLDCGFRLERLLEAGISADRAAERPDLSDERRRPTFLIIAARKEGGIPSAAAVVPRVSR